MNMVEIKRMKRVHKRMILEYSGNMPLAQHPKKVSELDQLVMLFSEGNPEEFEKAYGVIVERKIPSGDSTGMIASKVAELAIENIIAQENLLFSGFKEKMNEFTVLKSKEINEVAVKTIETARKEFITIQVKVGNKKPKKIKGIVCEEFKHMLSLAQERINIMMVGPSGCGKTHIASQIAEALELEYSSQSCSAGMSESQLTGWLLPIGNNGKFSYVSSEFIRLYENGGVFLFDEMDAADPNVLIFINQALANGQFSLPQRFEKPIIKKHKNFVAIAATNTFGSGADAMYHARNALDASTLDRFKIGMTIIKYSKLVEESLIEPKILNWGLSIRKAIEENGMQKIISTRVLKDATLMMKNQGWNMIQISNSYFTGWSKEEITVIKNSCPSETEIPLVSNPF